MIDFGKAGYVKLLSIAIVVGAAACSYTTPQGAAGEPDGIDAPSTTEERDASTIVPCGTPDRSGLVLCLELEDDVEDGVLIDSSPSAHHAIASGLVTTTRTVPAMSTAARVMPEASARVADDPALDLAAAYTIGVWIRPTRAPGEGEVFGLVDRELQYAMLTAISGSSGLLENRCVHTGFANYEWTEVLPVGTWSFLACTWDGTTLCAYRWSSSTSKERYCRILAYPPHDHGAQGLSIGHLSDGGAAHSRFDGALDSLQIYGRGMTEPQLCALIGQPAGCMPCSQAQGC